MRFVTVRDLRGHSAEIWQSLSKEKQMVITSNGRPVAILYGITDTTLEESLSAIRQARAIEAVSAMQMRSVKTGADRLTLDEINAEIAAARRSRSR